jgi:geranylgeranyl pyrophosphate synthase
VDESLKQADALVNAALAELHSFAERAETLKAIARFLVERKN